jgi:hypothetical protein
VKTEKLVKLEAPSQVIVANDCGPKGPNKEKRKMVIAKDYSLDNYLKYVKMMYGADNVYYKALEEAIRKYAVK